MISKDKYVPACFAILCLVVFCWSNEQVHDNMAPLENHHTSWIPRTWVSPMWKTSLLTHIPQFRRTIFRLLSRASFARFVSLQKMRGNATSKQNFGKLATRMRQYMYFMHKIIPSLANHDIPKKLASNCGMWGQALAAVFVSPQKQCALCAGRIV